MEYQLIKPRWSHGQLDSLDSWPRLWSNYLNIGRDSCLIYKLVYQPDGAIRAYNIICRHYRIVRRHRLHRRRRIEIGLWTINGWNLGISIVYRLDTFRGCETDARINVSAPFNPPKVHSPSNRSFPTKADFRFSAKSIRYANSTLAIGSRFDETRASNEIFFLLLPPQKSSSFPRWCKWIYSSPFIFTESARPGNLFFVPPAFC